MHSAGVTTALMGVLHFTLAGTLVMMICAGFFLEVRMKTSSKLPVCVSLLFQGSVELISCFLFRILSHVSLCFM